MSIREAKLNGKTVYSISGEDLRGKEVTCKHCDAKMHVHRFPLKCDYYFALNPGERHSGVCSLYEGDEDAPVITGEISPEVFIAGLSPTIKTKGGGGGSRGGGEPRTPKEGPKNSTLLKHIIKAGIYDEQPFDKTYINSKYNFIDYVIFDKWAHFIWTDKLESIGARAIDARWLGSFNFSEAAHKRLIDHMKVTKEIWFSTFWRHGETYSSVRFCLDCSVCFSDIKKKLFVSGINENGTYNDFAPKGDKVDALIGTVWAPMDKDQCKEKCPLNRMCSGCLGAYWGKCDGPKRVEYFPADIFTKNKEKAREE